VGQDAGEGDVGGLDGVRVGIGSDIQHVQELVDEMRVGTAVACALSEGKVFTSVLAAIDSAGGEDAGRGGRRGGRWFPGRYSG